MLWSSSDKFFAVKTPLKQEGPVPMSRRHVPRPRRVLGSRSYENEHGFDCFAAGIDLSAGRWRPARTERVTIAKQCGGGGCADGPGVDCGVSGAPRDGKRVLRGEQGVGVVSDHYGAGTHFDQQQFGVGRAFDSGERGEIGIQV